MNYYNFTEMKTCEYSHENDEDNFVNITGFITK